jgi:hypothetical protein
MQMVYRNPVRKIEAKFPTDLFLFRYGKRHKNTGLVYLDSLFAVTGNSNDDGKSKSVLNHRSITADTFDKLFGVKVGGN